MSIFWMAGTWNFGNFWFLEKCPVLFFLNPQKNGVWKNPVLPGSKIPLLAIHKIISHIWEDISRKVNNDEPDLRFFHGNFWPVISQAVRKPCFSTSIPRGPNQRILDFQTPPAPPPDEFSNPDPGPSQRTQGWNTSARATLAVDLCDDSLSIFKLLEGVLQFNLTRNTC